MGPQDREKKRAWKAKQRELARAACPGSDELLEAMFDAVDDELEATGCDDTLRHTLRWLLERGQPADVFVAWLKQYGGYCDCEVVANAREHWEENH